MRHILIFVATILCIFTAAQAQTPPDSPMTAAEFDAYSVNKTLTYSYGGGVFGTEQYLPNRRVRWAFTDDECRTGYWYPEQDQICFVYDHENTPQCWQFFATDTGLKARFQGDDLGTELSEVEQTDGPLLCEGPDVGV